MEKTVKIHAYKEDSKDDTPSKSIMSEDKNRNLEIERKDALLVEERSRTLEHIKTIAQLRESLKIQQEINSDLSKISSELQAKLNKLADVEENQLVKKNIQLEEEKKRSCEQLKVIELLKENIRQEREKNYILVENEAVLREKLNKLKALEENRLSMKSTELEEEKQKSIECFHTIDRLKESLMQEQHKSAALGKKIAEHEANTKELADMLRKISTIVAGV